MRRSAVLIAVASSWLLLGQASETASDDVQATLDSRAATIPGSAIVAAVIADRRLTTYRSGSSGTDRPLDDATLFQIGSITKTVTATALASLVRAGTVRLSDPVARYLPRDVRVPARDGRQITLETLATQHSGLPRIPDNLDASAANPYATYGATRLYAFLDRYRLSRDPGASFEYSNLGFGLLGLALMRADHRPSYGALVDALVFRPLGMAGSTTTLDSSARERLATAHDAEGNVVSPWIFTDATAGAGAVASDLTDMVRYLRCAMAQGALAATCRFAQQPRATFSGHRIGLAWWIDDADGTISHGGDTNGYHAFIVVNAARTSGAVVLSSGPAVEDIARHLVDRASPVVATAASTPVPSSLLAEYAGTYANVPEHLTYVVSTEGDRLDARIVGQDSARLFPGGFADNFYYRVVQAYVEFARDRGRVVGAILRQNGQTIPLYKIGPDGRPLSSVLLPSYPSPFPIGATALADYVGTYAIGRAPTYTVALEEGRLYFQVAGQAAYEIFPYASDAFYLRVVDAQVTFVRAADGRIAGLVLHQNGNLFSAMKQATKPSP